MKDEVKRYEEAATMHLLGFDLGFSERDRIEQRAVTMFLAFEKPAPYPDLQPHGGWTLLLTAPGPHETVLKFAKMLITTGYPVICWATPLGEETYFGPAYLFAIWSDKQIDVTPQPAIFEEYAGNTRIREVAGRPDKWHFLFSTNLNHPRHVAIIQDAKRRHRAWAVEVLGEETVNRIDAEMEEE